MKKKGGNQSSPPNDVHSCCAYPYRKTNGHTTVQCILLLHCMVAWAVCLGCHPVLQVGFYVVRFRCVIPPTPGFPQIVRFFECLCTLTVEKLSPGATGRVLLCVVRFRYVIPPTPGFPQMVRFFRVSVHTYSRKTKSPNWNGSQGHIHLNSRKHRGFHSSIVLFLFVIYTIGLHVLL